MRERGISERAGVMSPSVLDCDSEEFLPLLAEHNPLVSGLIVAPEATVGVVLGVRRLAQIGPPVIISNTIIVVDLDRRPGALHQQPSQAMGKIIVPVDSNAPVSVGGITASGLTNWGTIAQLHLPTEDAGGWVVFQHLIHSLKSEAVFIVPGLRQGSFSTNRRGRLIRTRRPARLLQINPHTPFRLVAPVPQACA